MTPEQLTALASMFEPKPDGEFLLPLDVAKRYNFPEATGKGQKIAVISPGGGYEKKYVEKYITEVCGLGSFPTIVDKCIPKSYTPKPCYDYKKNPKEALYTAEIYANLELISAIANDAEIVAYLIKKDGKELSRIWRAIEDAVDVGCSIILICHSMPETDVIILNRDVGTFYLDNALTMGNFDRVLLKAKKHGVTVCASTGNSLDMNSFLKANEVAIRHVEFPGSHPHVLSIGGTSLPKLSDNEGTESAWNEKTPFPPPFGQLFNTTTGGFSVWHKRPEWQKIISNNQGHYEEAIISDRRGVPDVAAHASSDYGYRILYGPYQFDRVGGTSSAAPIWAGLIARMNEKLGFNVGFLNEALYEIAYNISPTAFNDIIEGNNNRRVGPYGIFYSAQSYWDACTGLGSPNGEKLLEALKNWPFYQ